MRIYLIRHARQDSRLCNVDVSLSQEGIRQAHLLGKRLMKEQIDGLYSSDLIRAVETAEVLNQYMNVDHKIKKEFREISFGDLEGNTDDYNKMHFKEFLEELNSLKVDIPFPNGENGEDVCQRMYPILEEIATSGQKKVAIVTHGYSIRSILTKIIGVDPFKKLLFAKTFENCSITELYYQKERERFYLERLNDYAHLEGESELLRKNWMVHE